jgi:hypothetical protein
MDEIMAYDIIDLSARLMVIVNDDDGFDAMMNLSFQEGQSLVNLLQAVRLHIIYSQLWH